MNRNRLLIILGFGLPLLLCLYVASCGTIGFFWGRSNASEVNASNLAINPDATPPVTPVHRQPMPIERQTARALESATLPERDLLDLAQRLQGLPKDIDWQPPANPPGYEVGDQLDFWVHDIGSNTYFTSTATLRYATPHAFWWVENGYEIPEKDLKRSAETFENRTYPTNHEHFGSEWSPGVDGDPHVYIYLGDVPGVGGYYSGPD